MRSAIYATKESESGKILRKFCEKFWLDSDK
jgi:hypothetical protein